MSIIESFRVKCPVGPAAEPLKYSETFTYERRSGDKIVLRREDGLDITLDVGDTLTVVLGR